MALTGLRLIAAEQGRPTQIVAVRRRFTKQQTQRGLNSGRAEPRSVDVQCLDRLLSGRDRRNVGGCNPV